MVTRPIDFQLPRNPAAITKASSGPNYDAAAVVGQPHPALDQHAEFGLGVVDRQHPRLGLPVPGMEPPRRVGKGVPRPAPCPDPANTRSGGASAGAASPRARQRMDMGGLTRSLRSPLRLRRLAPIFRLSGQPDYGDKRARNKRIGPGGGTRRLHQTPSLGDNGAETGSTDV